MQLPLCATNVVKTVLLKYTSTRTMCSALACGQASVSKLTASPSVPRNPSPFLLRSVHRHATISPFTPILHHRHSDFHLPHHHMRTYAAADDAQPSTKPKTFLTIPTILTLARVAAIPALIGAWYLQAPWAPAACTVIFLAASITDWLDGYLARKWNASTQFGAFLDPVADKLMVATILILLSTTPIPAGSLAGNTWLLPVLSLAILSREITMSALREWAATMGSEARSAVAVNNWGKWKTATQMASLTMLLLVRDPMAPAVLVDVCAAGGPPLLCVATYLTVHSLALYLKALWPYLTRP